MPLLQLVRARELREGCERNCVATCTCVGIARSDARIVMCDEMLQLVRVRELRASEK